MRSIPLLLSIAASFLHFFLGLISLVFEVFFRIVDWLQSKAKDGVGTSLDVLYTTNTDCYRDLLVFRVEQNIIKQIQAEFGTATGTLQYAGGRLGFLLSADLRYGRTKVDLLDLRLKRQS